MSSRNSPNWTETHEEKSRPRMTVPLHLFPSVENMKKTMERKREPEVANEELEDSTSPPSSPNIIYGTGKYDEEMKDVPDTIVSDGSDENIESINLTLDTKLRVTEKEEKNKLFLDKKKKEEEEWGIFLRNNWGLKMEVNLLKTELKATRKLLFKLEGNYYSVYNDYQRLNDWVCDVHQELFTEEFQTKFPRVPRSIWKVDPNHVQFQKADTEFTQALEEKKLQVEEKEKKENEKKENK